MAVTLTYQQIHAHLTWSNLTGPADNPPEPTGAVAIAYWQNLLAVCTALVTRYAPAAPDAVQSEAVMRCAGYLHERPSDGASQMTDADKQTAYATGQLSALRHSGAMALLTTWKVRRAL